MKALSVVRITKVYFSKLNKNVKEFDKFSFFATSFNTGNIQYGKQYRNNNRYNFYFNNFQSIVSQRYVINYFKLQNDVMQMLRNRLQK